jgi:biotin operon repressor
MKYEEHSLKMEDLKHYLKLKCTGHADELAEKLGVSRHTVFNYLGILRDLGCHIHYDADRGSYCFDDQQSISS